MRDVAEATGLSPAAVSYALRGLQVPVETQERVRRAADELGYEVNPIARALASGRSGRVGVVCSSLEDLWQQGLAIALSRELLSVGRYAMIADGQDDPDHERQVVRQLNDQQVDGAVVVPVDPTGEHWAELARAVPVVTIGDPLPDAPTAGEVLYDNRRGVAQALEHLAGRGHRRIAVLTPSRPSTPERPAETLAIAQAARLGLELTLSTSPGSVDGAAEAAMRVLGSDPRPTAVFCLSDSMAYGVYLAAAEIDLDVPSQLSVMGYDDHQMSRLVSPPLTSLHWDFAGIVAAAVSQVVAAIDGGDDGQDVAAAHVHPPRRTFSPHLYERASTAPLR